ncbi:acyl-CoA thioesterase [Synechococcus elongatus]|uniref:1,4-dihydroxy-2-naphthoyl-CoA hydrolase n=1 Tax=Synechococcus elongatus PCC 11801 TaxID=2219813 RepID=A0AAN1QPQ8_SYNEL|nr:thioesterase family protein [Synechococcus elongatus]AZB73120.1 1,4-dihydroxy-2-naphthoyl-CoA hydrolase [Synechococcus elongatus PCC 11801]
MADYQFQRVVRFADTDAAGVVYFAQLLSICHEAYEAAIADLGFDVRSFFSDRGTLILPIVHAGIDYRRPVHCGDRLTIDLQATALSSDRFQIDYQVSCEGQAVAQAQTVHRCLTSQTRKRSPLPDRLQTWLQS